MLFVLIPSLESSPEGINEQLGSSPVLVDVVDSGQWPH